MKSVVGCESRYVVDAVGDQGRSHGLVQIFMPVWGKEISLDQAHDPEFALTFLAKKLAAGEGKLWTCFRKIGG